MEASRTGNVEIARLLLEKRADPNQTNNVCHLGHPLLLQSLILVSLFNVCCVGRVDCTDGGSQQW